GSGNAGGGEAYARLLTRWRHEVLRLLVQRDADRTAAGVAAAAAARSSAAETEARRVAEARAAVAESEADVLRAELATTSERLRRTKEAMATADADAADAAARGARHQDVLAATAAAVEAFRGAAAAGFHERDAALQWALARLREFEQRVALAAERVAAAAAMQRRREVQLRNAHAALAADRRVWRLEREEREFETLVAGRAAAARTTGCIVCGGGQPPAGETAAAAAAGGYGWPPSVLPGLRPECEAVMRAVFCRLDAAGAGVVDAGRLVVVLRADRGV
ncbi:unnamed protein product, partial [Phaeothamnion confervicola]